LTVASHVSVLYWFFTCRDNTFSGEVRGGGGEKNEGCLRVIEVDPSEKGKPFGTSEIQKGLWVFYSETGDLSILSDEGKRVQGATGAGWLKGGWGPRR